jgi:hypothetical protein
MSDNREAMMQALQAIDASLSVQVVARNQLVRAIEALDAEPQQEPSPGEAPAGCKHTNRIDLGIASGQEMCDDCGETI